ncbi:HK97 gp10 family phage protein [Sphingobium yanoikuyae]|uniref:HK97 gp10 family phage protein n=1 Tax=Sphingobium yanoikuyae TaxID=13690 RepID=UPI002432335E|nr:HK97 gp10 family phage protein [Sphingobium yanoikuyae]
MTVKVRGVETTRAYVRSLPEEITKRLIPGAGRAMGRVIADEAKDRADSDEVAGAIVVRMKREDTRVVVTVTVKAGWPYSLALWQEYGTAPHFISVADGQRKGRSIKRINQKVQEAKGDGSLVIGGKFVGATVWHPGVRANPFLRPALDLKRDDAVRAGQAYINSRAKRLGLRGPVDGDEA